MRKKGRQVFQAKIEGVTPSVAAPGVTHPSDATGWNAVTFECLGLESFWYTCTPSIFRKV